MGFFDLFKDEQSEVNQVEDTEFAVDEDTEFASEASMRLREEELDIHKDQVKTGEVVLHKEVVEEQKTVDVPVGHEQVVIKRTTLEHSPSDEPITDEETIHIPVTAERVEVEKHTVITGEISAHKREVQETEQIHEVLHKEVAHVDSDGDVEVIDEDKHTLQ
jgi:uncharacterized protein (TIGR02271 family)